MTTLTASRAPAAASPRPWLDAAVFHLALVLLLVWSQVALISTREMSADNTWHFRLARDVLAGTGIYWSAVDANRLFPDLLIGMAAHLMPGGGRFAGWLVAYQALYILLVYASLLVLGRALFTEASACRWFLLRAALLVSALSVLLPFWGGWLVIPGNHGGAVPVVYLGLAGLFALNRAGRDSVGGLLAYGLVVAVLVASNRVLIVTFVAPLTLALLLVAAARWIAARRAGPGDPAPAGAPLLPMAGATIAAGLGGHALWRIVSKLDWHQLVAQGSRPEIKTDAAWIAERLRREAAELAASLSKTWDVSFGVVVLLLTAVAAALLLARLVRRRGPAPAAEENGAILGLFAAASGLAAIAFVTFSNDDTDIWHYRFLAAPLAFAVVFLAALPAWMRRAAPRPGVEVLAAVAVPPVLALGLLLVQSRQVAATHTEAAFTRSIDDLARMIGRHSPDRPLRGYAEYWLANDVNTRSDAIRLGVLDSAKPEMRFYNNNAADLCGGGHFFILHEPAKDEPRRTVLASALGEPVRVETMRLGRGKPVEVLYYDPATIETRITRPGHEAAARLFPGFRCADDVQPVTSNP